MSDIFISYSSEDKSRVKSLAQALEKKGWSVWWDQRIPIGRSYDEVIEEALDASKAVVVVWTQASVKSQWVKNEAREGLRRRVLFPVMLLEAVRIPLEFRDVQAAHLIDWQPEQDHPGFNHFVDDIARLIGIPMSSPIQPPPIPQNQEGSSSPTGPTVETSPLSRTISEVDPVRAVVVSGNNNLSALTLSPGTLDPAFAASTTDYIVNVASNVTSMNISATKDDPDSVLSGVVTVGQGPATGQAAIQLNGPGTATLAVITVTAPNGNSKTYRITVNRAAPSGNNNLLALTVSLGAMSPAFNANTLNYTVDVAGTVTSVAITPKLQDNTAKMTMNGQVTESGQARTIALSGPGSNTLLTIAVTAPNGAQKTYTVNISRAALGGNNNLQSLTLSPGTLSPSFSASRSAYTVNVDSNVTSATVTPTLQDANSNMTINGDGINSGQTRSLSLDAPGSCTEIKILVTAPNGSSKTYLITVRRAALPREAEVEPEPEQLEPRQFTTSAGAVNLASPRESFRSQGETEFSGVSQESAHISQERPIESTRSASSTEFLSYLLPIGIGLLAALGAVAYLVIVRPDKAPYQPLPQSQRTTSELITPPLAPESIKQLSATMTQEQPIVKQDATAGETEAIKPRPGGPAKKITGKDGAPMMLDLEATDLSWVVIQIDNGIPIESLMRAGEKSHWEGQDMFVLTLGNAGGVKAKLDGKLQKPFGPMGKVARDIILRR